MKRILAIAVVLAFGSVMVASAADAKETFNKDCAKCHGEDGKGQTKIGPRLGIKDLTDPKVQDALTDEAAFKAIKEGVKNDSGRKVMKAFDDLSDADINGLVKYIRTFKK